MKEDVKKRTKWLHLRLTEEEYQTLHQRSSVAGDGKLSDYARRLIFSQPVTVLQRNRSMEELIAELVRLRKDLSSVGNNFNQVVRRINQLNGSGTLALWRKSAEQLQLELLTRVDIIKDVIGKMAERWLYGS